MVFFPVSVIINSKTIIRLSEVIDLKRLPLRKEHAARLAEYGLQNIPLNACCCLRFSAGEEVLREGQPIGWLSIVVDGNAKVCRTAPDPVLQHLPWFDRRGRTDDKTAQCHLFCEGGHGF